MRLCAHECVQVCASQEHTCVNAGCSRCRKSNPSCRGWRGRFSLPALHGQGPCAQLRRSCGSQRLHREQTAEVTGAAQLGAGLSRNLRALLQEAAPGPLAVRVPRRGTLGALTQARLSAAGPGPPAARVGPVSLPRPRGPLGALVASAVLQPKLFWSEDPCIPLLPASRSPSLSLAVLPGRAPS